MKKTQEPDEKIETSVHWKRAALMSKTLTVFRSTISEGSDDEDVDTKQQIKYGTRNEAAWALFSEYCNNSTIHGIRYLGEKKRPLLERLFWITVFTFSIYICITLTLNIWDKWNNYPVIVSFAEKSTPLWQIPFPAVTICSETKTRTDVFNFTEIYWKAMNRNENITDFDMTEEESHRLAAILQICDDHVTETINFGPNLTHGESLVETMAEIAPDFNGTYLDCKWHNSYENCENFFRRCVTDEGICYTFNSLSVSDIYRTDGSRNVFFDEEYHNATFWNIEDGYSQDAPPNTYPFRVLGPGERAGLKLILQSYEKNFDNLCRGPVQGFKVILHAPGEVPQVTQKYFRIPVDQEVLISIKPDIITTSEGLRHYDPHRRQCYFQRERYLRYFQLYTQNNCELECLANFTYKRCGCVKFTMPRHAGTPICGSSNLNCLSVAEDELLLNEFQQGIKTSGENIRGLTDCNCLPACTSMEYDAEISQADIDLKSLLAERQNIIGVKLTSLSIFFKEAQFLTSKRSELYGITDFLANCGGLLGLFMGVSMLSIGEIIYFCTVRLVTNLSMRRRKRKEMVRTDKNIFNIETK